MLWLQLDESAGTTSYDASGLGNDGTLVSMSFDATTPGRFGNALQRGGSTADDVTVVSLGLSDADQTIAFWVKDDNLTVGTYAVSQWDGVDSAFTIRLELSNQIRCRIGDTGWTDFITIPAFADGAWHNLAFCYDESADTIDVYHDGTFQEKSRLRGQFRSPYERSPVDGRTGTGTL